MTAVPPHPQGRIWERDEDGGRVLHLDGEIDTATVDAFERGRDPASPPVTVVAAENATFVNTAAVRLLVRVTSAHRAAGRRPVLLHPPRRVRQVLALTGVEELFEVRTCGS